MTNLRLPLDLTIMGSRISYGGGIPERNSVMNMLAKQSSRIDTDLMTIDVDGMTCASCVAHVERALKAVPGVIDTLRHLADACCGDHRPDGPILADLGHGAEHGSDCTTQQSGKQYRCSIFTPGSQLTSRGFGAKLSLFGVQGAQSPGTQSGMRKGGPNCGARGLSRPRDCMR